MFLLIFLVIQRVKFKFYSLYNGLHIKQGALDHETEQTMEQLFFFRDIQGVSAA